MVVPKKRRATYEDLEALPDNMVGEILEGTLYASPRPASPHAMAASTLGMDIGSAFQRGRGGPGGWWILYEPELHLGDHVIVPDLAGWRRERMSEVPSVAAFELAPDWVCEVLSPSTASIDRGPKMRIYSAAAVDWLWRVDPLARDIEVFERADHRWTLHTTVSDDTATARLPPFEAVELEVSSLWISAESPP